VEAWGFKFKTVLTWVKPGLGMGHYFRNNTEHVLFAVRGRLGLARHDVPTAFSFPRRGHSEKPEEFYNLVESCSPGPYLELFSRSLRPGWTMWGDEIGQRAGQATLRW
jgi:N6-adenosine-specific RNA methylase IME4